ncbi:MAG: hypothetical protein LUE27_10365, partial [Clostridia bacterium]|nr:hypothetical protein [Clostridia bacterium]
MRKLFASLLVMSALLSAGIANAALVSKNAYAYDIAVDTASSTTKVYVSYKLNAVASAVTIQAYAGEDLKGEFAGTTNASNSVAIPLADLPLSTEISFKIKVTSTNVTSPTQASIDGQSNPYYDFYSPYGIAVDNDPASAHFGRVLVTETKNVSTSGYFTSTPNGIGVGIYAFDPEMQPIQNASGTYGFTAGVPIQEGKYDSGHAATPDYAMDFKHIRYSDDGRLFLSSEETSASSLYEIDPDNLESGATAIFQGTLDETTGYIQSGEDFIAGPASAMDVYGSGEDLKIAILSTQYGQSTDPTDHRVDVYNLGTAASWSAVPSENVAALSDQYWDNDTGINMLFDADGTGLMITQARDTPSAIEPSRVHYSFTNSEIDYTDITSVIYGCAMAWNPDKTLVAMANSVSGIGIYDMYYDGEDLVLDEKYSFNVSGSGKVCALAWDYAGNLYVGANGSEKVTTYAIPRESADVVVPVTATITTPETLPEEEEEEEEVHELGEKNAYAYDIAVSHDDNTATVSY